MSAWEFQVDWRDAFSKVTKGRNQMYLIKKDFAFYKHDPQHWRECVIENGLSSKQADYLSLIYTHWCANGHVVPNHLFVK